MRGPASGADPGAVGDGLHLDEHPGVHQPGNLDHGGRGHRVPERVMVRPAVLLPAGDVGDEDPGTHHVGEAQAQLCQSIRHVPQRLSGLRARVILMDELRTHDRGAAGHEHVVPGRHRPAVPDDRLPLRAGEDPSRHAVTALSASSRVNAPAYRALPTIAPSTPSGTRAAIASRSARLETPPLAITGRAVRAQTCRSRSRFGPDSMPSLLMSVTTYRAHPSV